MADDGSCFRLVNVILLGVSFMLIFTAFQTSSMLEETVIKAAQNETNSTFQGSGYTSLAVIYGVFAVSNWAAPSVVAVIGPKWSMFIGGCLYTLFIASFLKPMTWTLYVGSVLVGIGAAILWTAQGNFLTINSNTDTIGRNSGVFWALLQCSLLWGNLYVYLTFNGIMVITSHTRTLLFIVLTSVGAAGTILLLFLRKQQTPESESMLNLNASQSEDSSSEGPTKAFKRSVHLLCTKKMALMAVTFAYTGFELTFWSGVFGTCLGNTESFGSEAKRLIGLCGMVIGVGEILGGAVFGLMGKRTNVYGRDPIILLGFLVHMTAFFITFLFLSAPSPVESTNAFSYIPPTEYWAVVCAFLYGFGDSCFNTQIFSLLCTVFSDESAPAFALFKFIQSVASAVAFAYSEYLLLQYQLLVMVVFAVAGTLSFFLVEWSTIRDVPLGYSSLSLEDSPD